MISYRATLDVPASTLNTVTGWLCEHRLALGSRPGRRALSSAGQALLVLRWMRDRTGLRLLARDAKIGISTAYRYLHEALNVLADHAPDLADVLTDAARAGWTHLGLDGTLIPSDRVAARAEAGNDLWYSGNTGGTAGTCRS